MKDPFVDSVRVMGTGVAVWAMFTAVVVTFLVSVPGIASDKLRPIDLLGILLWGVALSGRGGRLARVLLVAGVAIVSTAIAAIWLYPHGIIETQALLVVRFLSVFGSLAAVYVARIEPKQARRLLAVCAAVAVASCVSSIVGYRDNNPGTFAHQTFMDGTVGGLVHRLGGWVGESGAYGALSVVAAFALTIALARTRWRMFGYASAFALLLLSYTLSLARVCLVGAAVMAVCILIAERRRTSFWLLFVPCVVISVVMASYAGVLPEFTPQSLARLDLASGNVTSGRAGHWLAILAASGQTGGFLTGFGIRGANALFGLPTENLFVAAFADFGVVFGIVFLVVIGRMWIDFMRDTRSIPNAATTIMTRGMLVAVLLLWMFNDVTTYFQAFPLFAVTLGAALSLGTQETAEEGSNAS